MQLYHIYLKTYKRQMSFAPPVNSVAWVECESLPQQTTDWLEFTYRMSMEKARIKTRLNGKNLELSSPHLLIKRPGDIIEHPEPVVLESFWISYPKEAMGIFQQAGVPENLSGCELCITPNFSSILREIHQTARHAMESGMCEQLDMLCFHLIQETMMNLRKKREVRENSPVEKIAAYFRNNFAARTDLEQLLAAHGISRRSFFRHWKERYPMTPAQYIIHLKLNEACRLLAETEKTLAEITFVLNFQSTSYFCHLFHRKLGITPLEFRKKNRFTSFMEISSSEHCSKTRLK